MSLCYLDGAFLPRDEARISPLDRGFLFGDGAYEVIPVYDRTPFRLDHHLDRLDRTLSALGITPPRTREEWRALVEELVARNEGADQAIYVQVTRGADAVRNHAFPADVAPTVFMMSDPLVTPDEVLFEQGVAVVTAQDNRWLRCDLKTTALLANCLLRQYAIERGCAEAVLLRDGVLTEGSASNIFVVKNGVLLAPPKSPLLLPGITYDVVLELAAQHGMPCEVRAISEAELRSADELWMTSSTKEVLPITRLDDAPVGDGRAGPFARRMRAWYREALRGSV